MKITLNDIDAYISQIRASGVIGKSERRLRLLEHLVKAEILNKGKQLKAYSIALDFFDRSEDFDPTTDSIVRVEVGRLRAAIAMFEASAFADTRIRVEIPVGTYRPVITDRNPPQPKPAEVTQTPADRWRWGVLAFMCLVALAWVGWSELGPRKTGTTETALPVQIDDLSGPGILGPEAGLVLRRVLSRNRAITVLTAPPGAALHPDAEFSLRGPIIGAEGQRRASVELINLCTSRTVWAKSVPLSRDAGLEENLATTLGHELRVRLFGVTKDVLEGRDPERLSSEQLFVMATWVPGPATNAVAWELERVALMELALQKTPDFGAAHSVFADKLAYLANVHGPSNTPERRAQAEWHARRALELAPLDPDVMFNVAQSQWHSGHIRDSAQSMRRVVDLDQSHDLARFLALVVPYSCAVPPEHVLAEAKVFDADLAPDNPIRWLTLTWIAWLHLHREDYTAALQAERAAALIFQIPYTFMRKAVLLNKLGMPDRAAEVIRSQQVNWPGIDPWHFARVTIPRLCSEEVSDAAFVANYAELAEAMEGRL